jgi:hypothetical protein
MGLRHRASLFLALLVSLVLPAGWALADNPPTLTVTTAAGETRTYSVEQLRAMGMHVTTTSTPWTEDGANTFKGPLLRDVLAATGLTGTTLRLEAGDGYTSELPITDAEDWDVILAVEMNGVTLPLDSYGPAWIIYPYDTDPILTTDAYQARSAWSLVKITAE